ncbi:hypothetical protein BAUCODRAFT_21800 [Baudoinia panamericana UAMH 10762]|uniref:AB hydrolase-1 domain-containing protein n=1 Tax=Baudoinia panamericana (strain UAMH 10762) TaxID=717646 RepID=M2N7R5_BAUPA|nr:uncharacterized protein BAUCODRAFT_21800 [Baudoinia panamericana UAMH 10762]EMD00149.1 hypothetical protein BAUCODRAFT_21800 [Baudoinia panamericana UAMH 10762]
MAAPTVDLKVDHFWVRGQHVRHYAGATRDGRDDTSLMLSVKRYTPVYDTQSQGKRLRTVTILGAHGVGFVKELYEPLWAELVPRLDAQGVRVKGIWIADMSHFGMSGVRNEDVLGDQPSWMDYPRDLLCIINHFRDEMTAPIVGIGHSTGATSLIALALFHPRLLTHLVMIEPIMGEVLLPTKFLAYRTINNPDSWPSIEIAKAYFKRTTPWKSWDPRVLDRWMAHGVRAVRKAGSESTEVRLSTCKHQEAITYLWLREDGQAFQVPGSVEITARFPSLQSSVLFIFGGSSGLVSPERRALALETTGTASDGSGGQAAGRVEQHLLEGKGHLLPFEDVVDCAELAAKSISKFVVPSVRAGNAAGVNGLEKPPAAGDDCDSETKGEDVIEASIER